jgi:hypothetical protein
MQRLRGRFSLILWSYHNIYCACKFLCCHQTPIRGILKEHSLSLVFCVFDNNTWIRILPYVLKCVGFDFSTTDDDPPFYIGPISSSSELDGWSLWLVNEVLLRRSVYVKRKWRGAWKCFQVRSSDPQRSDLPAVVLKLSPGFTASIWGRRKFHPPLGYNFHLAPD